MRGGYRAPGDAGVEGGKSGVLRVEAGGGGGEVVLEEGDGCFVKVGKGGGKDLMFVSEGGKEVEWVLMEVE